MATKQFEGPANECSAEPKSPEQKGNKEKAGAIGELGCFSQHENPKVVTKAGELMARLEGTPAGDPVIKEVDKTLSGLEGKNARVLAEERRATMALFQGDLSMRA